MLFPDHPYLEPRHFVDEKAVNENHKDFMFLECILFITEVRGRGRGRSPEMAVLPRRLTIEKAAH